MRRILIFFTILSAGAYLNASSTIINVPADYPTIQEGINASNDGDTVLVQPGMYVENIRFYGHNIVLGSLYLTTGDTIYIAETIIDGDSSGSVVIFEFEEDSLAVITGFTIQNGFSHNGGGIYCAYSSPKIIGNSIRDNIASNEGGGIYCHYSDSRIIGNLIFGNLVSPQYSSGGGIHCRNSNVLISGNIIMENATSHIGGGIYCEGENAVITSNVFAGNNARSSGGAICCSGGAATITFNTVYHNSADWIGGAITCNYSDPVIRNNTFSLNFAEEAGGIYCWDSSPLMVNNIFWADSAGGQVSEISINDGSQPEVTYCDVQGGWEGRGNIDIDPKFRNLETGDFHLMSDSCGYVYDSPCIDAGDPEIYDRMYGCEWGLGGLRSDMGAYGGRDSTQVGIGEGESRLPGQFAVAQNYPNPFNATTTIIYAIPEPSRIAIEIYDILGRSVKVLVDEFKPPGQHQVVWIADDYPSGVYFCRLKAKDQVRSNKMILLK